MSRARRLSQALLLFSASALRPLRSLRLDSPVRAGHVQGEVRYS